MGECARACVYGRGGGGGWEIPWSAVRFSPKV